MRQALLISTKRLSAGGAIARDRDSSRAKPWRVADPTRALVVALAFVLGAMTIPPLVSLIQGSFRVTTPTGDLGGFTLDHYRMILTDRQRFGGYALHPLRPRLAVRARPLRSGQCRSDEHDGKRPAGLQRLFA